MISPMREASFECKCMMSRGSIGGSAILAFLSRVAGFRASWRTPGISDPLPTKARGKSLVSWSVLKERIVYDTEPVRRKSVVPTLSVASVR